jgi:hypothetical protein
MKEPFHPDSNLPDCMMPDGGDCCAGHAAVCEDWHKQRRRIEALEAALREARQYVSDAGGDEDCETQQNSTALLTVIDSALGPERRK